MSQPYRHTPEETEKFPKGIPYIIGNEAAERFSFYGMRAILLIFMAQYLGVMSAHNDHNLSNAEAVSAYHQFASWVYFTPLFGALLADVFFGKYRTILWLSLVYCLGHFALALMGTVGNASTWFITGLALICIGAGGIKSCVSAHVGDQFGAKNAHLVPRVFQWFYFSINVGSFFSMLLTPWLLEHYGPHWAFGVPGALMAIATVLFWMGRHHFIHAPAGGWDFVRTAFSREGLIVFGKLIPLFVFIAMFWALYDQTSSSWVLQAEQMDLRWLGTTWQAAQIQSINPIFVLSFIPLFSFVVFPAIEKVCKLTPLRKIGLGLAFMAISFALTTQIQTWIDAGQRPAISWQILSYALITAAEVCVAVVSLEFAYTQAPPSMKSWIMSLFMLSIWLGNQITAQITHRMISPSAAQIQWQQQIAHLPPEFQPRQVVLAGRDGIPGTPDDILAKKQGNQLELTLPDSALLRRLAAEIQQKSHDRILEESTGNQLLATQKTLNGLALRYQVIDSDHARIFTVEPQGKTSPWTQGVEIKRKTNQALSENSWLARRYRELGRTQQISADGGEIHEFCGGLSTLEGAAYFRFFTILILATLLVYLPFSLVYRPKSYLPS